MKELPKADLDPNTKYNLRKTINVMNHEKEKVVDQNDTSKEVTIKDRELANFWGRRAKDSSHWSMFLNTGNVLA